MSDVEFVGWEPVLKLTGLCKNTIKARMKDSNFPYYKPSARKYLFNISEVKQWIKERKGTGFAA